MNIALQGNRPPSRSDRPTKSFEQKAKKMIDLKIVQIHTANKIETRVYVNGEIVKFDYLLSRLLTETNAEDGNGIFTEYPEDCTFERGMHSVTVNFDGPWKVGNKTAPELNDDIEKRIAIVNEAFKFQLEQQ